MKQSGVYSIVNVVTGKTYVGSTMNLRLRKQRHFRELRKRIHPNKFLQEDFDKFGEESFNFAVLEFCSDESLRKREYQWMKKLDTINVGYNISLSTFCPMAGRAHTDETRAKMRKAHKNRKPISEETRAKLKAAALERERLKKLNGYEVSKETREKLSKSGKGRVVSEETKRKISEANSRPYHTEAQEKLREVVRQSQTGRVPSEQQRMLQSEAMKQNWQDPEFREKTIAAMNKQS